MQNVEQDYATYCKKCNELILFDLANVRKDFMVKGLRPGGVEYQDPECYYMTCTAGHIINLGSTDNIFFGGTFCNCLYLYCKFCGEKVCKCK